MRQAQQILSETFGHDQFRLNQHEVIKTILVGKNAMVVMPTGGGKSLCYQIPAMLLDGVGVVISPLISLMQDQVSALQALGVRTKFLNSTQKTYQQDQVIEQAISGQLDLLYISPERLLMTEMLEVLAKTKISLFAIDEAHCISQWGHDFRQEYLQLSVLAEQFPDIPRIALSATADKRTRQEIAAELDLPSNRHFISSFDRPNIFYTINCANNGQSALWEFLQENHPNSSGIIYCQSRKQVEQITDWLNTKGRLALPYHAGLDAKYRQQNQQWFMREKNLIMVATIAFGMGVDKPDVRFVAHLSLPQSIESYYQETGRAGRDGKPANAWMCYSLFDVMAQQKRMAANFSNATYQLTKKQKLQDLLKFCRKKKCRRQMLLNYFGEALPKPCGNCDNCQRVLSWWQINGLLKQISGKFIG